LSCDFVKKVDIVKKNCGFLDIFSQKLLKFDKI